MAPPSCARRCGRRRPRPGSSSNPVGPGAPPAGLPGRIAGLLRAAGPDPDAVIRLGDLSAYRDFVDVRDVARAAVLAATSPGPLPHVLNIGGGRAVPVRELVRTLARTAGFRGRLEEDGGGSARSGAVSWQCSDIAAAGEGLDWRPRTSYGTGSGTGPTAASLSG